jgi:FixJ family two-component response regulator
VGTLAADAGPILVYIVADDDAVRNGFARLLRSAGLDPRPYECTEAFLRDVRNRPNACVLLDLTLPRMTGHAVQARLREQSVTLPVITVTARDDDESRAQSRDLGARLFLSKPVDDQALLDAIHWVTRTAD